MDERGYDTFWMAEHHFQPEGTELIFNVLMMAMRLCGVTKNIKIGCGFTSCRCGIRCASPRIMRWPTS
jgi:alkanesulfonate monooxygenase SsuD/methylene tetrahydromethanopterin reductase-like flavin-dependent oxidoreductase (luciferase family)